MAQAPEHPPPFSELANARPLLQGRVESYGDELCGRMLQITDLLLDLEKRLLANAEIQERIDARLNSIA